MSIVVKIVIRQQNSLPATSIYSMPVVVPENDYVENRKIIFKKEMGI
jgi:hypothetical protein